MNPILPVESSIKTTLEHNSITVIEEDESHLNGLTVRNIDESPQFRIKSKKHKKSGSVLAAHSYFVPPYQKIYSHELP